MDVGATTVTKYKGPETDDAALRNGVIYVTVLTGVAAGLVFQLKGSRVTIGRGDNADVRVPGDTISRNHAQISVDSGGFARVIDLGSRNGTFVNGQRIRSDVLRDGDRVSFGSDAIVDLRYGYNREEGAANAGTGGARLASRSSAARGNDRAKPYVGGPEIPSLDFTIEAYQQLIEVRERCLGPMTPALAIAMDVLGCLHRVDGNASEAASLHQKSLKILEMIPFSTSSEIAQTQIRLARALIDISQVSEAEEYLRQAEQRLRERESRPGERAELYAVKVLAHRARSFSQSQELLAEANQELEALLKISPIFQPKYDTLSQEINDINSEKRTRLADSK